MKLAEAFDNGSLSHPLRGRANSVELFRAMAALSGGNAHKHSGEVDDLVTLIGHYDHYLFVLVDGLGMNLKGLFPQGGFLEAHLASDIRSVFPSTTAVALTSLATGLWPSQHGITGWWTHFPELQRVIAPLIFTERGTGVGAKSLGLSVEDLIEAPPVVSSFFREPASFLPVEITAGDYARWSRDGTPVHAFRNHGHLHRLVRRDRRRSQGPSYRYLYLLTVDKLCHRFGTDSVQVAHDVARIDRLLSKIREQLPRQVRMVVTADHGLVNVPPEQIFTISDSDPLCSHVIGGQTGEGRTPIFHVVPGHEEEFVREFARLPASEYFTLYSPEEIAEQGAYGPEPLSGAAVTHLGHFIGISTKPARLEYVPPGHEVVGHIGVHGGLLPAEMDIPLILA